MRKLVWQYLCGTKTKLMKFSVHFEFDFILVWYKFILYNERLFRLVITKQWSIKWLHATRSVQVTAWRGCKAVRCKSFSVWLHAVITHIKNMTQCCPYIFTSWSYLKKFVQIFTMYLTMKMVYVIFFAKYNDWRASTEFV